MLEMKIKIEADAAVLKAIDKLSTTGRLTGGLQYLTYVFLTLQFFLRNGNIHHPQRNHPPIFFT